MATQTGLSRLGKSRDEEESGEAARANRPEAAAATSQFEWVAEDGNLIKKASFGKT